MATNTLNKTITAISTVAPSVNPRNGFIAPPWLTCGAAFWPYTSAILTKPIIIQAIISATIPWAKYSPKFSILKFCSRASTCWEKTMSAEDNSKVNTSKIGTASSKPRSTGRMALLRGVVFSSSEDLLSEKRNFQGKTIIPPKMVKLSLM